MSSPNQTLQKHLSSSMIILDTCFALSDGFEQFTSDYLTDPSQYKMIVPSCVVTEINRHVDSADQSLASRASQANKIIGKLIKAGHAKIQGDPHETTIVADQVIQGAVLRFRTERNIAVLSNDVNLARALYNLHDQQAVQSRKKVRVLKLHAATKELALLVIRNDEGVRPPRRRAPDVPTHDHQQHPTENPFIQVADVRQLSEAAISVSGELKSGDTIKLENGTALILEQKLGSGGEGVVYAVKGRSEVCKLYSKDRLTKASFEKVQLLASRRVNFPGICWPTEVVKDVSGNFRGFLMPKATGAPLGQTLFLPTPFLKKNPRWTRKDSTNLAIKILEQIRYLHNLGVILGDINPQNFLLTDAGQVSLVDCDSFQVEGFPCPVGTVNFTPPELQGKDFKSTLRTLDHELFAVATLIFMIYFPGKSPYSHTGGGDGRENIKKGVFIYTETWERGGHEAPMGVWRYCWSHLTPRMRKLFELTFDYKQRGQDRTAVSEWLSALRQYQKFLNDPTKVFTGPKPDWGYDLSIMPQSLRFNPEKVDGPSPPADGRTGYDYLLRQALGALSTTAPPIPKKQTLGKTQTPSTSNRTSTSLNTSNRTSSSTGNKGQSGGNYKNQKAPQVKHELLKVLFSWLILAILMIAAFKYGIPLFFRLLTYLLSK